VKHRSYTRLWFRALVCAAAIESCGVVAAATEPPVEAVDFSSQVVFRSKRPPGYAAWVSFFPGENGQWYIGCEEVSLPEEPLPQTSPEQWYGMGLPSGYDKSQYLMEAVLLESTDEIKTWHLISHEPYRHQHIVGQFATPLEHRMKAGGTILRPKTDATGKVHVQLAESLEKVTDPHLSYQLVVRFNMDRSVSEYKPFQTPQFEFYAFAPMPARLGPGP